MEKCNMDETTKSLIFAELDRIINRQLMRCRSSLEEVNCPQIYVDCVFKYYNFAREDIFNLIKDMENNETIKQLISAKQ